MNCIHNRSKDRKKEKNERCACEPFVKCYNRFHSCSFAYHSEPERKDRNSPRPELLYCDTESKELLAIERKRIVHLTGAKSKDEFFLRHHKDHLIIEHLLENLPQEIVHGPYVLRMPYLHAAKHDEETREDARDICACVTKNLEELRSKGILAFESWPTCPREYVFYRKQEESWCELDDGPWDQLIVSMTRPGNRLPRFDWRTIKESPLPSLLEDAIRQANKKFEPYLSARKILLIERHGDIHGPMCSEFEDLALTLQKQNPLDEIWDAWVETPDYDTPYWVFTRLWSRDPILPMPWRKAEICCETGCHCHDPSSDAVFWFESSTGEAGQ